MDSKAEPSGTNAAGTALPADAAAAGDALPLAIAAWILVDPATALRLLEAWLATADGEGNLTPACPVACQLAERTLAALPDPDAAAARLLPKLAKTLEREFVRYDPAGTGLPRWPSAAEALFPAEFAPGRFTVDLAVLLSNEAAAFGRLAEGHPDMDRIADDAEGERRELDDWLVHTFWDEEASAFRRHDADGRDAPDESPCGFFPLAWGGRTEAMSAGLRGRAAALDTAAWPARAWVLFFALLLDTPHNSVVARLRRNGLPAGATPAERAAGEELLRRADAARAAYLEPIPPAARWLDAHGRGLARAAAAGGAVLLAVLLGWGFRQRERPGTESGAEWERRARLACEEGDHARAAALYGRAARRGDAAYFRYRQAGEWLHLERYADAEAAYREILARAPATPNARLNLAWTVRAQGRREEALELYRAFADDPAAAAVPELAARARLAAELLGRQLALDRD